MLFPLSTSIILKNVLSGSIIKEPFTVDSFGSVIVDPWFVICAGPIHTPFSRSGSVFKKLAVLIDFHLCEASPNLYKLSEAGVTSNQEHRSLQELNLLLP